MTPTEPASLLSRMADFLLRHRAALLGLACLLTVVAVRPASQLRLEESIQSFYAPDDPDILAWLESKKWFGGDEFVMVAYQQPDLLSARHLSELREFANQFRNPKIVPGVVPEDTKDLATTLNFTDTPAFRDMPAFFRPAIARILRPALLEFSRSVLIGKREDALCPHQVGPWRRTALDSSKPLSQFILSLSESADTADVPDLTGIQAEYRSGAGQFQVFVCEVSRHKHEEVIDVLKSAIQHAQGTMTPEQDTDDPEESGARFSLPGRSGALSWKEDWLFVFVTDDNRTDVESVRGEYLKVARLESDSTAVMMRLKSDQTDAERRETLQRIRELARRHNPPAYVAGEPVQIYDMFRYVKEDARTLGWATSGMLLVVILIMFRSPRWVVLPLFVVQATILWTKALLVVSDLKLSMVSSMLTSLVTIIGIATVMHVTVTFRELRADHDRVAAFRETFYRLAAAIFWTCATTAIGFLALLSSDIVPVRSFGLMVALGTMLVLAASALILPGGILIGRLDADPRNTPAEGTLVRMLLRVTDRVESHPRTIMAVTLVLVAAAAVGLTRIQVETDFSKNFRADSEIARSINFFETHLGGAGNWEVNFPAPHSLEGEQGELFLDKVRLLARKLRMIKMPDGTQLSKVYALTDGLDFIPAQMGKTIDQRQAALRDFQPDFEDQLYNPKAGRMRLFLRAQEQRPAEIKLALIEKVQETAREVFPGAKTTGLYVLIAKLITSLLQDQVTSFTWAAVGIAVAMTIAYRNVWIGLAGLVPNAFPILIVIGGMGWLDIPLNIGTAMIACVSMGLTVDSSIHYLTGYRRSRQSGRTHHEALRAAHSGVGRALVFANIALIAGFSVLTLSHFIPLVYFGVLVSVAMLGGLIGNLVLLPILLRWVPMRF